MGRIQIKKQNKNFLAILIAYKETFSKLRKIIIILSLIGVALLNSSCATIYDYYVSKSDNSEKNLKSWNNGVEVIELKNIRLVLQVDNQIRFKEGVLFFWPIPFMGKGKEIEDSYRKDTYFEIELAMKSYNEDFSFNPKEVYLRLNTGERIQAKKYYKPDFFLSAPNPNYGFWCGTTVPPSPFLYRHPFGPESEPFRNISNNFEFPKHKWIGFRIYFDTPTPNPGTSFSIEIHGLKEKGKKIVVPEIRFKDKKIFRDVISS